MSASDLIHRLPRHLKMAELRVFAAVLEHRSFRKAAAVLHLTQPAVTRSIASLETTLGVTLFDRLAGGVELTAHGRSFAPRAQAVFDELRRAAQELCLLSSGAVGALRVGVAPLPVMQLLPAVVSRMLGEHPSIQVSLVEDHEAALLERLRRRDIDLALLRMAPAAADADLRMDRLFDERLCVLAATCHPLAARSTVPWPELLAQRWVMPPVDSGLHDCIRRALDRLHLPMPGAAVEATSMALQLGLVRQAGLLSFGMCSPVAAASDHAGIVRLPVELPVAPTVVAAASPRAHLQSPLARHFIGRLQSQSLPPMVAWEPVGQEEAVFEATP